MSIDLEKKVVLETCENKTFFACFKENSFFLLIFLALFLVIASSFYNFYYKKNFDFIIETACDGENEECIYRDCTNPEDCPANQLSIFKRYILNAGDFANCPNEDCKALCEDGGIECELLPCEESEEYGEYCSPIEEVTEKNTKEENNEEILE